MTSISLAQAQRLMSLYGLSTFLVLGTVGNFLLFCVLIQNTHRRNSCSLYLLSITIVNFILIQCSIPFAVYAAIDVEDQKIPLIWCKMRSYLFNALLMLYRWYKMAACVDRAAMCSRHVWIRSFSQAHIARRAILIITFVWLLIPIHLFLYFRLESDGCVPQSGAYAKFFSAYSIAISGWPPPIVMIICGIISYRNLKKIRGRAVSRNVNNNQVNGYVITPNHQRIGRRDEQLTILIMYEVILYVITNLLYSINITYLTITSNYPKSAYQIHIESFITFFSSPFLVIINSCAPFYLYFIVSSKFRRDLTKLSSLSYCHHRQMRSKHNNERIRFTYTTTRDLIFSSRIHH
ncbi:unnamed protein product [Rotaria sp. Silwood1]|nr:unnamed protein product [Rotaria sp. Silwood1]CAF0840457.1 unnamed protein product [Rotaria sp. Silwood1]